MELQTQNTSIHTHTLKKKKKKGGQLYKHLPSQGHVKMAYRYSKFNAYCLFSCQDRAKLIFFWALPTHCDCIKVKVIQTCMSTYGIHRTGNAPTDL